MAFYLDYATDDLTVRLMVGLSAVCLAVAMDDPMAGGSDYQTDKTMGKKMDSLLAVHLAEVMENQMLSEYLWVLRSVLMNLRAVSLDVMTALDCLLTAVVTDLRKCLADKTVMQMVLMKEMMKDLSLASLLECWMAMQMVLMKEKRLEQLMEMHSVKLMELPKVKLLVQW